MMEGLISCIGCGEAAARASNPHACLCPSIIAIVPFRDSGLCSFEEGSVVRIA